MSGMINRKRWPAQYCMVEGSDVPQMSSTEIIDKALRISSVSYVMVSAFSAFRLALVSHSMSSVMA